MRRATTLPAKGTVRLPDGRIYTIAAPGAALTLGDIRVQVRATAWSQSAEVSPVPPGMREFATVKLSVTNLAGTPGRISLTEFWLVDPAGHEYLASADARLVGSLVGVRVPTGQTAEGSLVFPAPRRFAGGSLLVYRFADARAVARAAHVGIARL